MLVATLKLKTDINYDNRYKTFIKKSKKIKIKEPQVLMDFSRRLFNTYGLSEEFIKHIYFCGYIEGHINKEET